jgi:hypothetical protein
VPLITGPANYRIVGKIEADCFASWVSAQVESNAIGHVQTIADYAKRSHSGDRPIMLAPKEFILG